MAILFKCPRCGKVSDLDSCDCTTYNLDHPTWNGTMTYFVKAFCPGCRKEVNLSIPYTPSDARIYDHVTGEWKEQDISDADREDVEEEVPDTPAMGPSYVEEPRYLEWVYPNLVFWKDIGEEEIDTVGGDYYNPPYYGRWTCHTLMSKKVGQ